MSCNSPINIVSSNQRCTSGCQLNYTYGNASCVLVNNGNYLEMNLASTNTVSFKGTNYNLSEVRIYKPSLHTWDGVHADAEMVICHKGPSNNMYISIPIEKKNLKSESNDWFKKFMKYIPISKSSGSASVRVGKFTLNNVIPKAPYYYHVGAVPWCRSNNTGGPNNHLIVFNMDMAAPMNLDDFSNLDRINRYTQSIYAASKDVFFNADGTINGPSTGSGSGQTEVVDCYPVDIDGNPLTAEAAAYEGASPNTGDINIDVNKKWETIPPWFWTSLGIISGILVLFTVYFIASYGISALPIPSAMRRGREIATGAAKR